MTTYVLAALAVIVIGSTQIPRIWREEPDTDGPLGWWLPDTGYATALAVETRVAERAAHTRMRAWLEDQPGAERVVRVTVREPDPAVQAFIDRHRRSFPLAA